MITITRIGKTKRGRYALFSGEEFLFSVDEATLLDHGIAEGSSMTQEELSSLKRDSDTGKAKEAAFRYLAIRDYGRQELYEKLKNRFDEYSAKSVVDTLCSLDMLNDESFARQKADALLSRGKSRYEIRGRLAQLGLDNATVESAVEALPQQDSETVLELVQKQYADKLRKGEREKVLAALSRRGFSYTDAAEAVRTVQREIEQEDDVAENA